ncbi:MAG: hypothetical protein LPK00_01745 [Bacillaceae bacterium]|nr:hypothetical protein [Bacillaceae bacterium]
MKRDLLEQKLQAMPTAELPDLEKEKMYESIVKQTGNFKKRKSFKQTTSFIVSSVGVAAAIMLAVILFVFPGNNEPVPLAFVAEEEIKSLEDELLSYDRYIMLPTYAPFEIDEVNLEKTYWGPKIIENSKIVNTEEEEPSHWYLNVQYFSKKDPEIVMEIEIVNKYEMTDEDLSYMDEVITFSNDRKGGYTQHLDFSSWFEGKGAMQWFGWQENGSSFFMKISFEDGEILPKEEIIKIIESFKPLNPDFVPQPKEEEQIYFTMDEVFFDQVAIEEISSINLTRGFRDSDISKVFLTDEAFISEVMSTFKGLELERVERVPFDSMDLRTDSFYVEVNKNSRLYVYITEDGYITFSGGDSLNIPHGDYKILNEFEYFNVIDSLPIEWK